MSYVLNTKIEFTEHEFKYMRDIRILRYLGNNDISIDDFHNLYYYKEIKFKLENIYINYDENDILLLKNNIISYNLFDQFNDIIDCGFTNIDKTGFYSFGLKDNKLKLILTDSSLFNINSNSNSDSENEY